MSTFVIGDVQGCYDELLALLKHIAFNDKKDQLWFTGDLVSRGPKSLEVLRFVMSLRHPIVVLGNHDLHLLSLGVTHKTLEKNDTLHAILTAPDRESLLNWLRHRPLLHHDAKRGYLLVHAGLFPQWDLTLAKQLAREVETILQGEGHVDLLTHMYSDQPDQWDHNLTGIARWRFIINAFTRMRFCDTQGRLELQCTGVPTTPPPGFMPWFQIPDRASKNLNILFGHWAALSGKTDNPHYHALDTGCIWGQTLTALRLKDKKRFEVLSHTTAP